jgi:hypothetical protein
LHISVIAKGGDVIMIPASFGFCEGTRFLVNLGLWTAVSELPTATELSALIA